MLGTLLLFLAFELSTTEALVPSPTVRRVYPDGGGGGGGAVRVGDRVTLHCRLRDAQDLTSSPALYSWYWNGAPVTQNTTRLRLLGRFLQVDVADPRDNGVYSCGVETSEEQREFSQHNFVITVRGMRSRPHRVGARSRPHRSAAAAAGASPAPALRFAPAPVDKKLELNSTGRIHCKVVGGLQPNVTWYKNSEEALPLDVQSTNGTLSFTPTLRRHRGNYTCRAVDGDSVIHTTIVVDVVVSPRVLEPESGAVLDVSAGEEVWLHCRAVGDPPPTTHWDRDTSVLTPAQVAVEADDGEFAGNGTRIRIFRNGSLVLRGALEEDSDRYGCIAGSSAGLARHELTLRVHAAGEGVDSEEAGSGVGSKAVVVSVAVAAAYMLLVLALMLYCRRRRAVHRGRGEKVEMNEVEGGEEKLIEGDEGGKSKSNGAAHARNGRLRSEAHNDTAAARSDNSELSAASRASKRSNQYEQLAVPRTLLTDHITLGRGEFGEVILAKVDVRKLRRHQTQEKGKEITVDKASTESEEPRIKPVMIKALGSHEESHLAEFRRQLEMFSRVKQENVVRLLGMCTEREPHYMLLEYTDWGELKQFLLATRSAEEAAAQARAGRAEQSARSSPAVPLTLAQASSLAAQLARAGRAVAAQRLVHRDIGARNCIISSRLQLKLSLPALSRGPHSHEYYKHLNQVMPLRWLPAEAVLESDYSTKSDVYMFAATVWEILHKGELPFSRLNDASVLTQLRGNTLSWTWGDGARPPPALLALTERCWSASPAERPQFEEICREMSDILQEIE